MCPEDVALVVRDEFEELWMSKVTQLFACYVERLCVHSRQSKLLDGPIHPVVHMHLVPLQGVYNVKVKHCRGSTM